MAQKVNPISLRLGKTNRSFDCCWFNGSNYANLLMRDFKIQSYINLIMKQIKYSSARYLIENLPNKVKVHVFFYNPNKDRKNVSKIFYLSFNKKIKNSKKNFFNKKYSKISVKQSKIFQYLIKNSNKNNDLCLLHDATTKQNEIYGKYFQIINKFSEKNTLEKSKCNLNFITNYLNIVFSIKKLNEFYIKYFIIKYFSSSRFILNKFQRRSNLQKKNTLCAFIMNFLFLKIYKNKTFFALNYFQIKMSSYKMVVGCYDNLLCKTQKNMQPLLMNNYDYNYLYENKFILKYNVITKLQILNYLKKFPNQKTCQLTTSFNKKKIIQNSNLLPNLLVDNSVSKTTLQLVSPAKIHLNFFLTKLKYNYKSLQFFNKINKNFLIVNYNTKTNLNQNNVELNSQENRKYYNVSLLNNQYFNKTYSEYCNLSNYSKYYNSVFLQQTVHSNKVSIAANKLVTVVNPPYKYHLESIIRDNVLCNVNLNFFKTKNMFQNALFLIDEIIYYIEKRVPFFKIKNYILRKLTDQNKLHFNIKGIRVICSGRVKGKSKKAQRSKIQNFKYGETSLHVFSSKIDFKSKNAFTSFGTLGVKVWICYH